MICEHAPSHSTRCNRSQYLQNCNRDKSFETAIEWVFEQWARYWLFSLLSGCIITLCQWSATYTAWMSDPARQSKSSGPPHFSKLYQYYEKKRKRKYQWPVDASLVLARVWRKVADICSICNPFRCWEPISARYHYFPVTKDAVLRFEPQQPNSSIPGCVHFWCTDFACKQMTYHQHTPDMLW